MSKEIRASDDPAEAILVTPYDLELYARSRADELMNDVIDECDVLRPAIGHTPVIAINQLQEKASRRFWKYLVGVQK